MSDPLPELAALLELAGDVGRVGGRVEVLAEVGGARAPILALHFGAVSREAPVLVLVGGVHGLERIGTEVVLAYATSFCRRLRWDAIAAAALERARLVIVPLLNPIGMMRRTRANGRGVDLMRNAPDHPEGWATPLIGGQRLTPRLPWYRGREGDAMEPEARALVELVEREAFSAELALALDVHSGFGLVDRLWFPYARTRRPLPHLPELFALRRLLDETLPHHVYRMEPQARTYTVKGDLWDHLYDRRAAHPLPGALLPLTLEMGSWMWLKKNPRQALSALGSFNPVVPHRLRRTLRRHLLLIDFLHRAVAAHRVWAAPGEAERAELSRAAFELWYGT
ncbi:MAG TPA: M14 family zinc carboxypeptidase [Kofleriaceae bacterium]|nr:M14 family zinc carboxypeptidase [Kofleriaceae bacterium]